MKKFLYLGAVLLVLTGCSLETTVDSGLDTYDAGIKTAKNSNGPTELGIPTFACGEVSSESWIIEISAGQYGTPGGFKLEWMKAEDYEAAGMEFTDNACSEKFNGEGYILTYGGSPASIDLAQFVSSQEESCFGAWECEEIYVFRIRAENLAGNQYKASNWSEPFYCATQPCEICPFGKGYWRNHSNDNTGNQIDTWLGTDYENGMSLGSKDYSRQDLNTILDMENSKGNGLVNFSQHLIAAKLNYSIGVRMNEIEGAIEAADELIGEKNVMDGSFSSVEKTNSKSIKDTLTEFNDQCSEEE